MVRFLTAGTLLWPVLLAVAVDARVRDRTATWPAIVYVASSRLCHQLPERSFHRRDVQWPVCARCLGLYFAAPLGAIAARAASRRARLPLMRLRQILAAASLPTVATLLLEHSGAVDVTNGARFAAALPLGAAIAAALIAVASGRRESIK